MNSRSLESRERYRLSKLGEKNPMWKGDSVGIHELHAYIKRHLAKPNLCEFCHEVAPYDLANKTGKYLRDFNDWFWLCRRCHMKSDGRITRLRHDAMLGKHHSEETRKKLYFNNLGRQFSEEWKRNISLGKKGQGLGAKRSQEWKEKIRLAALRRWQRYRDGKA